LSKQPKCAIIEEKRGHLGEAILVEQSPRSNVEVRPTDVFSVVNNYFLLFFCASCVISSIYLQQIFIMMGQYRVGISVSAILGIILPVYLLTRRFGASFRSQIRMVRPRLYPMIVVALATLAAVVIVDQIYLITQQFSPAPEEYMSSVQELRPNGVGSFIVTFLGLCMMVPMAEELVFRGVIQQIFTRNMGPALGFILGGLVFGAVHLNAHLLISISFFGVFLGFIYYATGNITYSIVAHSLFNAVALLQLTFNNPATDGELPFYLSDVRIFVVALVLMLYALFKLKQGGPETEPPYQVDLEDQSVI